MSRKQQLLKRHRRTKRIGLLIALVLLIVIGVLVAWWLPLVLAVLGWMAHEAWFADHLFYSPKDDYQYSFPPYTPQPKVHLSGEHLRLDEGVMLVDDATLVLALRVKSTWLGRFFDPVVELAGGENPDRQTFERGVNGLRYLNLSGQAQALSRGDLRLRGRFCRVFGEPVLWALEHPDYRRQRVMVIAPHADDAELAAYGLYSQADETWIVTLTAGEIEAEHYRQMGLNKVDAARLKGRLRTWDSIAVPRWAGVPEARCVQLGYFCLQLASMQAAPGVPAGSREADLSDTRLFRQLNPFTLPGDADGAPTWNNLLAICANCCCGPGPRSSCCRTRPWIRIPIISVPRRQSSRPCKAWTGNRPRCWATPTTCTTTTVGRWAIAVTASPCRRPSIPSSRCSPIACRCRWSNSGTRPWRWA